MSRAKWKGDFLQSTILKHTLNKTKKIWSRCSSIPITFLNNRVSIYNGKTFRPHIINSDMIGFKFGEFCLTRTKNKKTFEKAIIKKSKIKK